MTIPTVAKLPHVERCTGTVSAGRRRGRRCRWRSRAALDGRALCPQHLDQALVVAGPDRFSDRDMARAVELLAAEYELRGDLLQQVVGHLLVATRDPVDEELLLAVVPVQLTQRIQEALLSAR